MIIRFFYVDPAIDESCSNTPCFLFFLHIENNVIKYWDWRYFEVQKLFKNQLYLRWSVTSISICYILVELLCPWRFNRERRVTTKFWIDLTISFKWCFTAVPTFNPLVTMAIEMMKRKKYFELKQKRNLMSFGK